MLEISALPESGDTVAGKYRIEAVLGHGGMSVVYRAAHVITGRRFAIKLLRPEVSFHPDAARRLIRESQVSGRLQHPNVIEIFDIGEDRGSHYMVMEWLDGESLADRVERTGRLSLEQACSLLLPAMEAVAAAHAAGIIHRDLKPANIFICRPAGPRQAEHVKVLDFGISKLFFNPRISSMLTRAGTVLGTPYYMSPEQMEGQAVDARTDVYAFGVILYQVLAGRLPFAAKTYNELVVQIITGRPPPLEQLAPGLPRAMTALVARAMAPEPDERFQTMEDLIAALKRVGVRRASDAGSDRFTAWSTTRLSVVRTSSAMLGQLRAVSGRGPWRAAGIAMTVLLLLLTAALLWLRSSRPVEAPPTQAPKADPVARSKPPSTSRAVLPSGLDVPPMTDAVVTHSPAPEASRPPGAVRVSKPAAASAVAERKSPPASDRQVKPAAVAVAQPASAPPPRLAAPPARAQAPARPSLAPQSANPQLAQPQPAPQSASPPQATAPQANPPQAAQSAPQPEQPTPPPPAKAAPESSVRTPTDLTPRHNRLQMDIQ